MLLENKVAVIYGAGGSIGGAVARAFATEGARLYLAGRTLDKVEATAAGIVAAGGSAEAAQVDALDRESVEGHARSVAARAGRIDVLFNAIGMEDVQGPPLLEMSLEDFIHPVLVGTTAQFLTAQAIGRRMVKSGSGVMLTITAGPPEAVADIGGFGPACRAIEGLWRGLAAELGPHGVRLVCLRSAGSPETPDLREMLRQHAETSGVPVEQMLAEIGSQNLLQRMPTLAEVADMAVVMASDRASALTGAFISVTCGSRSE